MVAYYRSRKSLGLAAPAPVSLTGAGEPLAQPVAYPPEIVPDSAKDVVAWVNAAIGDRDARLAVALEVENARAKPRATVLDLG